MQKDWTWVCSPFLLKAEAIAFSPSLKKHCLQTCSVIALSPSNLAINKYLNTSRLFSACSPSGAHYGFIDIWGLEKQSVITNLSTCLHGLPSLLSSVSLATNMLQRGAWIMWFLWFVQVTSGLLVIYRAWIDKECVWLTTELFGIFRGGIY